MFGISTSNGVPAASAAAMAPKAKKDVSTRSGFPASMAAVTSRAYPAAGSTIRWVIISCTSFRGSDSSTPCTARSPVGG